MATVLAQPRQCQLAYVVDAEGIGALRNDYELRELNAGDAVVRVVLAGVCSTDLHILNGYAGFTGVLGHEFVGVVESVESDSNAEWVGQRVCADINAACGTCRTCKFGGVHARNHCENRKVLGIRGSDGTFAQRVIIPMRCLHRVPNNVPDRCAVFAEPLAAALRIVEQLDFRDSDRVAVLGDGKLGYLCATVIASQTNVRPFVFGRHKRKLELMGSSVDTALSEDAEHHRGQFDIVVEATGTPSGLDAAIVLCRPLGTVVLKSTCATGVPFSTAPLVINELRVIGSRCGSMSEALKLLADGFDTTKLIDATFDLEEADKAIEAAARKGTLKVLIRCSTC